MLLLALACTQPEHIPAPTQDSAPDSEAPACDVVTFEGQDWTERFLIGEVVVVDQPGTLTFCDGDWFVLLVVTSQVTVEGMGVDRTVLSGGEQGTVVHATGPEASVRVRDATLDRGYARGDRNDGSGAGVRCDDGASVQLSDVVLSNHNAYDGAGLYARDGCDVQLQRVDFMDNIAEDDAGALRINDGSGSLVDVSFTNSSARDGGAIVLDTSVVEIQGATFTGNVTRDSQGGGVLAYWSELEIRDTVFEANDANSVGAALALFGDTELFDVTFRQNTAYEGGVVHLYPDAGSLSCQGCSWDANTPQDLGVQGVGTYAGLTDFTCDGGGCR